MPRKGKRRRVGTNIYADARGLEAAARVTLEDGQRVSRFKRYDRDASLKDIKAWQRDTEAELRKLEGAIATEGFAEDVERYLPLVREELASFEDRARHLRAWIPIIGTRKRHKITTAMIDRQLRTWRNVNGLSASTVNQRRDALSDFFQKLGSINPVKGAVWFARKRSEPKGLDRARIQRVLEAMDPDRKTRWRLMLMHWTGMRPSQMGRLSGPEDFYLDDRAFQLDVAGQLRRVPAVMVPSGKGGGRVLLPLTPEGEEAARHFLRVDAFWRPPAKLRIGKDGTPKKPRQTWSCPSAAKRIAAAATAIKETPFNVYAIKHSYASALLQTGTDSSVIQEMLAHADIKSTLVYARAVSATHVQALDRLRAEDQRRYDQQAKEGAARLAVLSGGSIEAADRRTA